MTILSRTGILLSAEVSIWLDEKDVSKTGAAHLRCLEGTRIGLTVGIMGCRLDTQ